MHHGLSRRPISPVRGKHCLLENAFEDALPRFDEINRDWRGLSCQKRAKSFEIFTRQKTGGRYVGDDPTGRRPAQREIREYAVEIGVPVEATFVSLSHESGKADSPIRRISDDKVIRLASRFQLKTVAYGNKVGQRPASGGDGLGESHFKKVCDREAANESISKPRRRCSILARIVSAGWPLRC